MRLTSSNYHSIEAEREYLSRSQYQGFLQCEAKQIALLAGDWTEAPSEALLVGQYVHAWSEGTAEAFKDQHPEMFTKAGKLRASFRQAETMIETLKGDPLCLYMLEGQKEVPLVAEFAGAMWRIKMDVYNHDRGRIVDLKTTRSIWDTFWSEKHGGRVSFIEQYDYLLQAALYCEIERQASGRREGDWLDYYIVAVSKDTVPDKAVIDLRDPERYRQELDQVRVNLPRILQLKAGEEEPIRCERCDYCRSTKVLTGAVHWTVI